MNLGCRTVPGLGESVLLLLGLDWKLTRIVHTFSFELNWIQSSFWFGGRDSLWFFQEKILLIFVVGSSLILVVGSPKNIGFLFCFFSVSSRNFQCSSTLFCLRQTCRSPFHSGANGTGNCLQTGHQTHQHGPHPTAPIDAQCSSGAHCPTWQLPCGQERWVPGQSVSGQSI